MVESNRSERPFLLQTFKSPTMFFIFCSKVTPAHWGCQTVPFSMWTFWCFSAPLEFRNSRLMLTMDLPFHTMFRRFSRHLCHRSGLKVLFVGEGNELVHVLGGQRHSHTLLALADGQLGAVEAVVLLGDLVQVDIQAVGQLADGDGDAAGTKVVAALDHLAGVLAAEQALQLALDGGVALLDLSTAVLEAVQLVGLGGTGSTADAVAAGAAAQQDDDIAGERGIRGGRGKRA